MSDPGESQYLSVLRVWAAMAWADGVITDSERTAMKRLIAVAELSSAERDTARGWLESPVEVDAAGLAGLSGEARTGIYRAAVRLAGVDLELAPEELRFLERLRAGLGIDDDRAREIEAAVQAS